MIQGILGNWISGFLDFWISGFLGLRTSNAINLGHHLVGAEHYRDLRVSAFEEWGRAVA